MSQEIGIEKIVSEPHDVIMVEQPLVRDYSTGGGHGPEDTLVEGDEQIVTQKWQGYAPENLNVVGKSMPPMAEVAIPRFLGTAQYATRVWLPNMLYAKVLVSPHPHARIRSMDTTVAERMPGVAHVLTHLNAPNGNPARLDMNGDEVSFVGDIVAIVAAETEDLAEDAVAAINVDYEVLPGAGDLAQVLAPGAPDLRQGRGNLLLMNQNSPHYDPDATFVSERGNIEQGFAEADEIREFEYYFGGAIPVPMQPCGAVAHWEGDRLTFYGMNQGIYPYRAEIARGLGISPDDIHYINKWNGCTFGSAMSTSKFNPFVAHIAKVTDRPVKLMLPKDQELAHLNIKPENKTSFRVGLRDGRIHSIFYEMHMSSGDMEGAGIAATAEISKNNMELYTAQVPHWKTVSYAYKTNVIRSGCSRSCTQQEVKWAWESMIDEMAEVAGVDPVPFRRLHVSKPGDQLTMEWHSDFGTRYESENGAVTYDSFASVEVIDEGARAIGWEQRNPVPGGNPGRFKRGFGVAMSQHHPGHMGYHEGEIAFQRLSDGDRGGPQFGLFTADLELNSDGEVIMKNALPDSGTNHDTALAHVVAEMLGYTTRDQIRVVWGDSERTPLSQQWLAGKTITLQGAAICSAVNKLIADLTERAEIALDVDPATLEFRDGVISSTADPEKTTTFAALALANGGSIIHTGQGAHKDQGRALAKGVGACFLEVEVDTWTGDWRMVNSTYCHDTGKVVNPLVAEADMLGSLIQSTQMTTDAIPWDREFPGTRHYSVGYLSFRLPTIMDVPDLQQQVFVDSLEPRWFYGIKSFSETSIGSVPGAIANAIYNACGVRIREHPITREKIMAGLKELEARA